MTRYLAVLLPLAVLLAATVLACLLGYVIAVAVGDALPLRKIISKTTLLLLVLSIFPLMAYFKMDNTELGFAEKARFFKQLLQGFGLGAVTLAPVFVVLFALDIQVLDTSQPWTAVWLLQNTTVSLLLALLISALEEPLFRGLILMGLARRLSKASAILTSAFYYAALHFLDSKTAMPAQDINLLSGFKLLAEAFANLLNPAIYPAFAALLMVGIFLGLLRTQRQTSLGLCIGCHTAWVWQIKMSKALANSNPDADYFYLVNPYDGVVGYLVAAWLFLVLSAYGGWLCLRQAKTCQAGV